MDAQALTFPAMPRPKVGRVPAILPENASHAGFDGADPLVNKGLLNIRYSLMALVLTGLLVAGVSAISSSVISRMQTTAATKPDAAKEFIAAADISPERPNAKSILIQERSGTIVGQLAKIDHGDEQITEVRNASSVDEAAGRDLLSIINKY